MQASPRVYVDEAPYAPGNDLLYVTELEDAHDSIKLLKSDDNLEFFYTETLSIFNSDETSGQCKKTCLYDTYSAQLIAGIITCQFEDDLSSVRKSKSRTQWYSAWMNLRLCKAFEREKITSVFSSFPDLPNASSVGSLNHATIPISVRRSVVCIPNMSTFRALRSLCVSLCLLARLYTAIHRPPAHRLTCMLRRRLDQTAFGFAFVQNMCRTRVSHCHRIHAYSTS